jgi:hypothetical protein
MVASGSQAARHRQRPRTSHPSRRSTETHSVQVLASNVSVTPSAFLGDVSLAVTVHEN